MRCVSNYNDNRPIGVFDSGVGGLTVIKQLRALMPFEDLVYFGDTARVPYGGKSEKAIKRFSVQIAQFLVEQDVKIIIVACNSASSLALSHLKQEFQLPVVGVIDPGVRAAVKNSVHGSIGVIGTKATINSQAYQIKINKLKADAKVIAKACPLFVPIVEENLIDSPVAPVAVKMYLDTFIEKKVGSLILACTHYPLLKKQFEDFLPDSTVLIDSALETAREVKQLLGALKMCSDSLIAGSEKYYVSDSPDTFSNIAKNFLGEPTRGDCIYRPW